jgi:methylphosphotriester-DNA--protein-cysteine methyltransferase
MQKNFSPGTEKIFYKLLFERNSTFEGIFIVGVKILGYFVALPVLCETLNLKLLNFLLQI